MVQKLWKVSLFVMLTLFSGSITASAQEIFADWTSSTTFDVGAINATASTSNPVNAVNAMLTDTVVADSAANYPDAWYTPTPPVGILWSNGGVDNVAGGSTASVDVTVTFSSEVVNPRFHFLNLDNGTIDFGVATVNRLSGNPEFEVTGAVVNSTPNPAAASGCEDGAGGNPNGACGTVELVGSFTMVTFTVTDTNTASGNGDGFQWTASIDPALGVAAIPTASEWGLLIFALLLAIAAASGLRV